MKWFNRQKDNPSAPPVPPELQQYYSEREPGSGRNWARIIPRVVAGLIIIALIVLLIIWAAGGFSGDDNGTAKNNPSGTSQNQGNKTPKSQPNGNNSGNGGRPQATIGGQPDQSSGQPETAPNHAGKGGASGQDLTNTGPGDTIAAFAAAAIAGAGLHQLYIRRRETV